jgi:hypothetical protein
MQRFIFRVLFAMGRTGGIRVSASTIDRSGKEAEKPLGKVFPKMSFVGRFGGSVAGNETCLFKIPARAVNISRKNT